MTKPLCYAPFIGIYADHTGEYAPCCVSKKIDSTSLDDFWNGEKIKNIRKTLLDNQWPDECSYCKNKAEKNLKNDIEVWDVFSKKIENLEVNVETGNQHASPLLLDFRPGNKCNLKCRMCGPKFSNQWQLEIEKNPELENWLSKVKIEDSPLEDFINFSDKLNLLQIKILGGEPTIDENVLQFLEHLISKKEVLPKLHFTTNGTNLNKRFQNIMASFNDIHVTFSVDATEEEFEYIRTNANWKKVQKNIETVFENNLASTFSFNTILMPYNIFSLKKLLSWYVELNQKGHYFTLCVDTSEAAHTSLSAVLKEDVDWAIAELEEYLSSVEKECVDDIPGLTDFLDILKSTVFNKEDYDRFKKYNNLLDNVRKTSLLLLDERFSKYV